MFDDRVGTGVFEPNTGQLRAFVETDAPAVREWAEAVYEADESEALRTEEFSHRCFRGTAERGSGSSRAETGPADRGIRSDGEVVPEGRE